MPVAAVKLPEAVTAVPLDHPLHQPTPANYVQPAGGRANSDDDGESASTFTTRTQHSVSSKSTSSKPGFSYFVARYANYDDQKSY